MTELQKYFDKRLELVKNSKSWPDKFMKHKKIGKNKVTIVGGKNRGASILVYSHMSNKDETYNMTEEIHFMYWRNAMDEYTNLKKSKDILNIISRNQ